MSAIGNGFTFGLQGGALGELGSNPAFRAAVTNATTQAIGVVTGLQKSFDWKGVAASAIGASVGQFVGEKLGLPAGGMGSAEFVAKATLQGIAAGTAAAIARGGRLAVQQVAVDAFGNALGQSIAEHAKPQGNPIYSLSSGENGVGLRGGASGDGMSYGGRRATVTADGSRQQGQSITTPDLDAGAVAALRENLGLPGHSPEEGWVLAAGPINGSSLGGYGPPLPVFGGPLTRQGANGTDESSAVLGATAGVAGSFGKMALGAAREGSNLIMQVGDLLTGGFNHDHPVMQQVWAEQRALGTRLVNLLENPVAAATDLIEGVVSRYEVSMSERTAFDRSYALGNLFNDVGQGAVGALFGLRGLVRFGADGMEFIAANALASGPVAGGRAAQFGAINPRSPRYQPGVASFGEDLLPASGRWLDAARPTPIPLQVARQLEGQSFKTFPELQAAIWRSIGSDPELSIGFSQQAIGQMSVGNAPFAPKAFQSAQFGARFNLHHIEPVATGGAVYDMSNIQIVAPRVHGGIHYPGRP